VRNRFNHPRPALRRLAQLLALAALTVGVLPATGAGAESRTVGQNLQLGSAPAATWSLIATLDPAHVQVSRSELTFYGAYAFTPLLVNFEPRVLGSTINQSVVPMHAVPADGRLHTYKVVFDLGTDDAAPTTSFRFTDRTPVTVAGGVRVDVEFIDTIQAPNPGNPGIWRNWALRNANNDHWLWFSVKIYEQTS
jgi:hypothetical protein